MTSPRCWTFALRAAPALERRRQAAALRRSRERVIEAVDAGGEASARPLRRWLGRAA
jgi:hypothetical protein